MKKLLEFQNSLQNRIEVFRSDDQEGTRRKLRTQAVSENEGWKYVFNSNLYEHA